MNAFAVYTDGGVRGGNPGRAGFAAVVLNDASSEIVGQRAEALAHATSNFAELKGIELGLKLARQYGAGDVVVFTDSKLALQVLQNGHSEAEGLNPVITEIARLETSFDSVDYAWIPREKNEAHELCAELLDGEEVAPEPTWASHEELDEEFLSRLGDSSVELPESVSQEEIIKELILEKPLETYTDSEIKHGQGVLRAISPELARFFGLTPPEDVPPATAELVLPKDHLSASQLSKFLLCPEKYRQNYVLGKPEPPGSGIVVGGAFHVAAESYYRTILAGMEPLTLEEMVTTYHRAFNAKLEEAGGVEEVRWDSRETADTARTRGQELVSQYVLQVAPNVKPLSVETPFELELEGVPVPVTGRVDLVTEGGPVIDHKTSARKTSTPKGTWRPQAAVYELAFSRPVEFHVAVKGSAPVIQTAATDPGLLVNHTPTQLDRWRTSFTLAARRISWCMTVLGPDRPWPDALTHDWACDYCGYRQECFWHGN